MLLGYLKLKINFLMHLAFLSTETQKFLISGDIGLICGLYFVTEVDFLRRPAQSNPAPLAAPKTANLQPGLQVQLINSLCMLSGRQISISLFSA